VFLQSIVIHFGALGDYMAKYECLKCGWTGKPLVMQPVTRVCPKCGSVQLEKIKK